MPYSDFDVNPDEIVSIVDPVEVARVLAACGNGHRWLVLRIPEDERMVMESLDGFGWYAVNAFVCPECWGELDITDLVMAARTEAGAVVKVGNMTFELFGVNHRLAVN